MEIASFKGQIGFKIKKWFYLESPIWFRLAVYRNLKADRKAIEASRLFNEAYYCKSYPEVRDSNLDPIAHYCLLGWRLGYNPSDRFDTQYYLTANPDIQQGQINPLLHYISRGQAEKRAPLPNFERLEEEKKLQNDIEIIQCSGLFDSEYYQLMYLPQGGSDLDLIYHYCREGWSLGCNPSENFDTNFYIKTYPDVPWAGMNPYAHYLKIGAAQNRRTKPGRLNSFEKNARFATISSEVQVLASYHEPDWPRMRQRLTHPLHQDEEVFPMDGFGFYDPTDVKQLQRQAKQAKSHGLSAFCFEIDASQLTNSTPCAWRSFHQCGEIDFGFCLNIRGWEKEPAAVASAIAEVMRDPRYFRIDHRPLLLIQQPDSLWAGEQSSTLSQFRVELSTSLASDPFFMLCSDDSSQKRHQTGIDAVLAPPHLSQPLTRNEVCYYPYEAVAAAGIKSLPISQVLPQDQRRMDPLEYQAISLSRYGQQRSDQVHPAFTQFSLADFRRWLDQAISFQRQHYVPERRLIFIQSWNNWNDGQCLEPDQVYGFARLNTLAKALLALEQEQTMPMVSVIVPNYNHAKHLRRRLESIYHQTYQNFEVLLLDDCSTDSSRELLNEYAQAFPAFTRLLYNDQNSGGVFRQWAKGIKASKGELVWIAESDDYCALNFLEVLIKQFNDEAVLLAYCKPVFVDQHENSLPYDFESYLRELNDAERWMESYVQTAHQEVCQALGIKNTIPNASGVLFRRPISLPLLDDPVWLSMRVVGDWVFYLNVILGGKIAYSTDTTNYFRRYQDSTAGASYGHPYFYREISYANIVVARLYDVPIAVHEKAFQSFRDLFVHWLGDENLEEFTSFFDYDAILKARQDRLPNILIAILGFYPGGAEILPIRLANELRRRGLSVAILSHGSPAREYQVRAMVDNNLPVLETFDCEKTRELISEFAIDVLNSHHWPIQRLPNLLPDVFSSLKAHVAALHGQIENTKAFNIDFTELKLSDRFVTSWIYTADKNLAPFRETGLYQSSPERFHKLPNGIEKKSIERVNRTLLGIPEEAFVLCCVSRAIPEKGWLEMIDVVRESRLRSGKDIRLILVGNGPVYDELRNQSLPSFIVLTGYSSNSTGFYATSDMGIMLSKFKSESFPLTIVDCLFAGKPYIASDVGEIRTMLSEGEEVAGALIPLREWQPVTEVAVKELLKFAMDETHYNHACRLAQEISLRYRIDHVASQYLDVMVADVKRHLDQSDSR